MPGLDDYGALIRSGQATVPDYAVDEAKRQYMALQQNILRQKQAEAQREIDEHDAFDHDLATVLTNPSAQGYSALIAKHPAFATQIKQSWDILDKSRQNSDLQSMGEVYSAAANGRHDVAAALMQRRIDADKTAGQPEDPHDQAILDALKSNDPVQTKAAMGMIGVTLSAITGPDKFEQTLGALTKGKTPELRNVGIGENVVSIDPNTNAATEVYKSPYFKDAEGNIAIRDNAGGGGQPSPPGATPSSSGPVARTHGYTPRASNGGDNSDAAVDGKIAALSQATGADPDAPMTQEQFGAFVRALPATEGSSTSLSGAANNPGGIKDGSFAKGQPGYVGSSKGFAVFKDRDAGFAAMQNLLTNRYYNRGQQSIRDIIEGKPTGAPSPAASPTSIAAADAAPPGYHWISKKPKARVLTPDEATARGLSTDKVYELRPDGTVTAVGDSPSAVADDSLDPGTTAFYAQQILAGGQMPTLGMGKSAAAARRQIMKEVARQAGGEGLTGADLATQIAHYKSATKALGVLETQSGTVEANEQTALANGQQFLDRSREVTGQSKYPLFNSISQFALRHTGDPTVRAMDAAWNTFTTEYAKVVAGSPSGAGTLSDSARHEAQDIMRTSDNLQQKEAVFKQMQADMANRMTAIRARIKKGYDQLTTNPRQAARAMSSADLPKGAKVVGTYRGKRVIEVNGKRMVEQ